MTKEQMIDELAKQTGWTRRQCKDLVGDFFQVIGDYLTIDIPVHLYQFGTWFCQNKAERIGREPKTGKTALIKKRRVVAFKASNCLRKVIQSGSSSEKM